MSHIITELKNLSLGEVTNNDFIIVTEVTNSLGQIETKTMNLGEYTKYNITSSNVLNTFRSGSHSGTFIGNLLGSSLSASISTTASFSNTTNYLSSSSNNGTASYSINANSVPINSNSSYALTSSYATNSVTSSRASYVNIGNVTYKADTSDFSNNSISASSSQKTNYLNFNGTDNGIVYHSINSDTSSYSSIGSSLSYPNTSTAHRSITSSYSSTSISASYSPSSSYADFSNRSIESLSEAHAYITLIMDQSTTNKLSVKEYYNINHVVIQQSTTNNEITIIFQFENALKDGKSAIIKVDCSSRVQFSDPAAYTNNTDLYDYRTSVVLKADNYKDNVPMDMIIGTSCSTSVAKITLISKEFGQTTKGTQGFFSFLSSLFCFGSEQAEQHETPAAGAFSKCYISLIVLNGDVLGNGKNYPEKAPTQIPPKC
jgi:hypothetical protein